MVMVVGYGFKLIVEKSYTTALDCIWTVYKMCCIYTYKGVVPIETYVCHQILSCQAWMYHKTFLVFIHPWKAAAVSDERLGELRSSFRSYNRQVPSTVYSLQTRPRCQEVCQAAHSRGHHAGRRNSRRLRARQAVHRRQCLQGSACCCQP